MVNAVQFGKLRGLASVVLISLASTNESMAAEAVGKFELPQVPTPDDNRPSDAKLALGKQLFFDRRLSRNNAVSCATCHDPAKGWSNRQLLGVGVDQQRGTRNVPTLFNVAYNKRLFWDGRADSLEQQALQPLEHPAEMDMPLQKLVRRVNDVDGYRGQFREVFGSEATPATIAKAIASFERTINSRNVPLDRFAQGEKDALSESAIRGMQLFFGDANCHVCHSGPNFTDQKFHNIGAGFGRPSPDRGRAAITGQDEDQGAFKTPTLREIRHTAPYMHDGSFETLEQVVRHYNFGGVTDTDNPYRDEALEVLYLSENSEADVVTFLKEGLSNERLPRFQRPYLPD